MKGSLRVDLRGTLHGDKHSEALGAIRVVGKALVALTVACREVMVAADKARPETVKAMGLVMAKATCLVMAKSPMTATSTHTRRQRRLEPDRATRQYPYATRSSPSMCT